MPLKTEDGHFQPLLANLIVLLHQSCVNGTSYVSNFNKCMETSCFAKLYSGGVDSVTIYVFLSGVNNVDSQKPQQVQSNILARLFRSIHCQFLLTRYQLFAYRSQYVESAVRSVNVSRIVRSQRTPQKCCFAMLFRPALVADKLSVSTQRELHLKEAIFITLETVLLQL